MTSRASLNFFMISRTLFSRNVFQVEETVTGVLFVDVLDLFLGKVCTNKTGIRRAWRMAFLAWVCTGTRNPFHKVVSGLTNSVYCWITSLSYKFVILILFSTIGTEKKLRREGTRCHDIEPVVVVVSGTYHRIPIKVFQNYFISLSLLALYPLRKNTIRK